VTIEYDDRGEVVGAVFLRAAKILAERILARLHAKPVGVV
jgi:uncharacterized protein YuzE